jgi:glycosyltransferase involved in cell wall biosynthesis
MDAGIPEDYTFVSPNGIQIEQFDQDIERDPAQVIYFSHPGRGLDRLREVWPQIHQAVPEASLASFWWEPEHFRSYNSGQNILPMRKLGHMELAAECLKSGVFGYPSVFAPEICPITTMKAQLGGAIPVVVIQGGMVDTIKYGVQCSQGMFAQELISALRMSIAGDLDAERSEMMAWARDTYSWKSVAEQWSSVW